VIQVSVHESYATVGAREDIDGEIPPRRDLPEPGGRRGESHRAVDGAAGRAHPGSAPQSLGKAGLAEVSLTLEELEVYLERKRPRNGGVYFVQGVGR